MCIRDSNNGVLPLAKTGARIAVMGPNAVDSVMQWGNYEGCLLYTSIEISFSHFPAADVPEIMILLIKLDHTFLSDDFHHSAVGTALAVIACQRNFGICPAFQYRF